MRSRLGRAGRKAAVATLAGASLGLLVANPIASAGTPRTTSQLRAQPSYIFLAGSRAPVTVDHQSWFISVYLNRIGPNYQLETSITRGSAKYGSESHSWNVSVPTSALTHPSPDKWILKPLSSATAPLETVDLTFLTTRTTRSTCTTGKQYIYFGSLSGEVEISTGLSGAGEVGFSKGHFTSNNDIVADYNCQSPSGLPSCQVFDEANVDAFPSGQPSGTLLVVSSTKTSNDELYYDDLVDLSAPKGAIRIDAVQLDITDSVPGRTSLTAQGRKGAVITGNLSLSAAGSPTISTNKCKLGKARRRETNASYGQVSATSSMVAHFELTPSVDIQNTSVGYFSANYHS